MLLPLLLAVADPLLPVLDEPPRFIIPPPPPPPPLPPKPPEPFVPPKLALLNVPPLPPEPLIPPKPELPPLPLKLARPSDPLPVVGERVLGLPPPLSRLLSTWTISSACAFLSR